MIETYFINNDLGYITIPQSLSRDGKVTIDQLRQSVMMKTEEEQLVVIKAFLGDSEEESEIKAINWFVSRKLSISTLEDWYFQDTSNYARIYKTYNLMKMSKYLVKEIRDYFGNLIIATVLEVLKLVDTEYGTIVIYRFTDKDTWYIETSFLHELEGDDYKFSDNEEYKDWVNEL